MEGTEVGTQGAVDASLPAIAEIQGSPDDGWILNTAIDEPVDEIAASLPGADGDAAAEAAAAASEKPIEAAGEKSGDAEPKESVKADDAAAAPEGELSEEDEKAVAALPAEQQHEERAKRRKVFMDHFISADTPDKMEGVRSHLFERSPSQYGALESSVLSHVLSDQSRFCRDLYGRDPEGYSSLAREMFTGNPEAFLSAATGREGVTPEQVTTALDFYDRNKDRITDDVDLDGELPADLDTYYPEVADSIREAWRIAKEQKAADANNGDGKTTQPPAKPEDQAAREREQQAQAEISGLYDVARDVVGDQVVRMASDPAKGAGITVTAQERKDAPLLATLKDFKRNALFYGLNDEQGNPVLPHFQEGFIKFAEENPAFKDTFMNMTRFISAREEKNVREMAGKIAGIPNGQNGTLLQDYYSERLKNPIFAAIDQLIDLVAKQGSAPPKFDRNPIGGMPSQTGGRKRTTANANDDSYLIADAIARDKG